MGNRFLLLVLVSLSLVSAANSKGSASVGESRAALREEFLTWKFGLFIHFNLATFNARDWANGYEDPDTFAPGSLDCGQWADIAKDAGMKYAVLTVKHTEGYPLWDSAVTQHDITAFKRYKGGKGDIVRQFVDAFRARGLKVGLYYCAPGDYDNKSGNVLPPGKPSLHGMPPEAVGNYFGCMKAQFTELLTQYGRIDLIWCDQYRVKLLPDEWQALKQLVHQLQPQCIVIANNSHDLKETDVCSFEFPVYRDARGYPSEGNTTPSEVCDTVTRSGTWFWRAGVETDLRSAEDVVRSLRLCNARHANYLLDVGPDDTGLIPSVCADRLRQIGALIRNNAAEVGIMK